MKPSLTFSLDFCVSSGLLYVGFYSYSLFQAAWTEVQQSFTELSQTRSRIQQLKTLLKSRKAEAEQEVSGIADENLNESLAL